MERADLEAWLAHMAPHGRATNGRLSDGAAARLLGCSRNTLTAYREGRSAIPPYIALACAALAFGLPPWKRPS